MVPIISVVGKSGSGKTWLLERLIPELKRRGYRVAVAKHSHHRFDLDVEGKDSWRLARAGGDFILLFSPEQVAFFRPVAAEPVPEELPLYLVGGYDVLLVEGFRRRGVTKIEVHRRGGGELLCSPQELWAVVTDEPLDVPAPQYSWEDVQGLADLIERTFLASRPAETVELYINGRPVPLKPFVQEFISGTVKGMVAALKGIGEIKSLELRLRE